ncbi:haloacid dehalogenase type II [Rhodococcus sp. IEGM 1381]|uniref:haloacid dehalogenase type II n=1 Tax=Rhodococcus sp. IEGM 1381 TaxID=3047085 RepID=UPI0024B66C8D|nr:haloacid dehalogenase type II [Rhodococcus sp. IEGM 1381]MDI9893196.1 haloacid dehalogenase type II [Rhodococcus sp. IEGM 1381]
MTDPDNPNESPALRRPRVIIFDVNETLSDMSPLSERFTDVGAPAELASLWFASVLRDGFALTAADAARPFADVASGLLAVMLPREALNREIGDAVEHIMGGFMGLDVHPDVADGIKALAALDIRLITLSNGAVGVAQKLLDGAGVLGQIEMLLSVEAAGAWKPAAQSYRYALDRCGVEPHEAMLVAVHPWDIDGAHRAGLSTAWINRTGTTYPQHFTAPDLEATSLLHLEKLLQHAT